MTTPPFYLLQSLNEREMQLGTTVDQKQTEALRTSEKEKKKTQCPQNIHQTLPLLDLFQIMT